MSFFHGGLLAMRIGISACLLGNKVRYDGGHKECPLTKKLAQAGVVWIPICPEAECGLGVPREPMRLEGDPQSPIMKTLYTRFDQTDLVTAWSVRRLDRLADEGVKGFVLKSRSPSCGVIQVPVFDDLGLIQEKGGMGIFVRACRKRFPKLPMAEESILTDWATASAFLTHMGNPSLNP